jgi:hypothetical protein
MLSKEKHRTGGEKMRIALELIGIVPERLSNS